MHWGRSIDILPCVTCLRVSYPNFRFIKFKFKLKYNCILVVNKLKCHIYWVVEMYTHGIIICVNQGHTFVAK
jgi:hypothetical protein